MLTSRRRFLVRLVASAGFAGTIVHSKAFADTIQYTYDALGRVTSVTYPTGWKIIYTYDLADNRTQVYQGIPPLTATASPLLWEVPSPGAEPPGCLTTVTGGVAPYAYLWQYVSGNAGIAATSPTASSTTWSYSGTPIGPPKAANWRCRVTDSASTVVYTANVLVRIAVV